MSVKADARAHLDLKGNQELLTCTAAEAVVQAKWRTRGNRMHIPIPVTHHKRDQRLFNSPEGLHGNHGREENLPPRFSLPSSAAGRHLGQS